MLKTIAERLRSVTRAEDIVARLGGDKFVVVQTEVKGQDQFREFSRRLPAGSSAQNHEIGPEVIKFAVG